MLRPSSATNGWGRAPREPPSSLAATPVQKAGERARGQKTHPPPRLSLRVRGRVWLRRLLPSSLLHDGSGHAPLRGGSQRPRCSGSERGISEAVPSCQALAIGGSCQARPGPAAPGALTPAGTSALQSAVAGRELLSLDLISVFFFPCRLSSEATLWASGFLGSLCRPFPEVFTVAPESQVRVSISQIRRVDIAGSDIP